jgi:hypothetical protein
VDAPFSDTHSFSLANTIFEPPPIVQATVEMDGDFGDVAANHIVHWTTDWTITDADALEVKLSITGNGGKSWTGTSTRGWDVILNSTLMWQFQGQPVGFVGAGFDYQDSHNIIYLENATGKVPAASTNGDALWDSTPVAECGFFDNRCSYGNWGHDTTTLNVPGGALWFVRPGDGDTMFGTSNTTYEKYWLANMTHPGNWTITNSYYDKAPNGIDTSRRFETSGSLADRKITENDGCAWPGISSFIGFCPTLAGLAGKAVSFVPETVGVILNVVHPGWGDFFKLTGQLAGEFVSAYFFTLTLIASKPGSLIFIIALTASGAANLIGALRGDLGTILELHVKFAKALSIAVFWYFYMYWLMLKYAVEMAVRVFNMLATWADALIPL